MPRAARNWSTLLARAVIVAGLAMMSTSRAGAQSTNRIDIASAAISIPAPGPAELDAGFTQPVALGFIVDAQGSNAVHIRITRVQVRCQTVTGGLPCGSYQWRLQSPGPPTAWTDLSTTYVIAITRCIQLNVGPPNSPPGPPACFSNPIGEPYNGTLEFRAKVNWTTVPRTYTLRSRIRLRVDRQ